MNRRLVAPVVVLLVVAFAAITGTVVAGDRPSLGLDLQGGASVTLQPEGNFDANALDVAVEIIRARVDSIGVAEPEIIRQGDTVVVNLPGVKDQQRALDIVGRTGDVQLRGVLQAGVAPSGDTGAPTDATTPTTDSTPSTESTPTTVSPSTSIDGAAPTGPGGSRRIAADTTIPATTPVAPATVASTDTTVPGATVPGATTATTSPTPDTATPDTTSAGDGATNPLDTLPAGVDVLQGRDGLSYLVAPAGATGQVFDNTASAGIESGQWTVVVGLRRGAEGEDLWNALTTLCYNRDELCPTGQVAIVLDGEVISAPVVQEPVFTGGQVQITGNFTETEARDLAKILEFGAVPVKFAVSQVQTVSPTLGDDTLRAAIIAGIVGVALVLVFMLLYYRLMTVLVLVGLVAGGALQYSAISYLSRTNGLALTLAGIAGLIVSVGMGVDSYIVMFERVKDGLYAGRTPRNAVQSAVTSAWKTVLIANVVSFLGAGVLWWLTVGSVRGFAFFLGLATVTNVVVVYYFLRPALLLVCRGRWANERGLFGVSPESAEVK
jgi:preprotein translocase subunit SecD